MAWHTKHKSQNRGGYLLWPDLSLSSSISRQDTVGSGAVVSNTH